MKEEGKKWLEGYYRSLGWSEHRIDQFMKRAVSNEKNKLIEVLEHKTNL